MMKPMTARDYRANAEKVKAQRPTEIVTLKSGSVFELRRPDLQGYVVTGRVPQSLLAEGMKAWKQQGKVSDEDIKNAGLDLEEIADSLVFMREVVHECTVKPKFVEFATNDDEIGAADMLPEDFTEIFNWGMTYQGVAGLTGLQSFRKGQKRRTAGSGSNRKKQRDASKQAVEPAGSVQ